MAERRAMNKYYPPDWDPSKGSINTYVGQHALRDRARKLNQGILIIRFEMPFNVWCLGCSNHIGRGTRYNAEKKKVGQYLSSKILSFSMKCHLCDQRFVIETDPQHSDFKVVSGLNRKIETPDEKVHVDGEDEDDDGKRVLVKNNILKNEEEKDRLQVDPMFKLQHVNNDKETAKGLESTVTNLYNVLDKRSKQDYALSSLLRKNFREQKKQELKEQEELIKKGISIQLLPESQEDHDQARKTDFSSSLKTKADQSSRLKLDHIKTSSIISSNSNNNNSKSLNNEVKRKSILLKKSRLDGSLFGKSNNNNIANNSKSSSPTINSVFSSNLFSSSNKST